MHCGRTDHAAPGPSDVLRRVSSFRMREISMRNKISSMARTFISENVIAPAIRSCGPHKARKAFAVFAFPLRSLRQNIPHPFPNAKFAKNSDAKDAKPLRFFAFFVAKIAMFRCRI